MKHIYRLVNPAVRERAIQAVRDAYDGMIVTINEPTRNLEQNSLLWKLLSEISEQIVWHGNRLTPDQWKDVLSASLYSQKVVPGIDGGFVVCGQRTSKMTKSEFSEMLELIHAFAAEQGVRLPA